MPVLALLAIGAVAAGPVFGGRMVSQPRSAAEQQWWSQTADWLAANSAGGRALLVPGAGRPNMVWGQTVDDPLQPLARRPWTVRDGLPLTQPGYIRFLDAFDQILAAGRGDDTLPVLLARAGVKYLVLRNDLDNTVAGAPPRLSFVHATIHNTAGLRQVAAFGPDFGGGAEGFVDLTDARRLAAGAGGADLRGPPATRSPVGLLPADQAIRATGSADALPALVERGLGVDQPVILGPPSSIGFGTAAPAGSSPGTAGSSPGTDGPAPAPRTRPA